VLLIEQEKPFVNRQHFFAVVTRVMLRALMKYHGGHNDSRRGGGRPRVSLAAIGVSSYGTPVDALELLRVLESLREHDVQCANVVTCRCLFGKTTAETAADLGMSERHVDLAWEFAKAWLVAHLGRDAIDPS
jgi:hypothetical protein